MHRLFIAIRPPCIVRERLLSLTGRPAGARWQLDDQLHLTLRFIGEVDAARGDDLVAALGLVRSDRFSLVLEGAGTFASKGRVHTLWAGIQPTDALTTLRRRIDRAVGPVEPAGRPGGFVPHVTLARFSRGTAPPMPADLPAVPGIAFEVQSFQLFESTLTKDGAVYSLVERYALG